jgi:hypothetical protein
MFGPEEQQLFGCYSLQRSGVLIEDQWFIITFPIKMRKKLIPSGIQHDNGHVPQNPQIRADFPGHVKVYAPFPFFQEFKNFLMIEA